MAASQLLVISALVCGGAPRGVVYDFTASWCGPCQEMSPVVSRLERQGFPIQKVDVDQYRQFAARHRITSIPAFVLFVDGKEVDRIVGATSEQNLRRLLARIPKSQPKVPDGTLLVNQSRRSQPRSRDQVASTKKKPKFRIPFFSSKEDEQEQDISQATVRANLGEPENDPEWALTGNPLQASVRIRAKAGGGINYGSGTVISSRNGKTVVLTCGHICRGLQRGGIVEVDLFDEGGQETYEGKVLRFDLEADVALLEVATDKVYPHAPVSPAGYRVKKGDDVVSVGCGGGDDPTLQNHRVISLNRYLGPDHLECSGEPVEGRSGGGLFSSDGAVVGVCFARDPEDHRGLYAGLKPIHQLLDQCGLSHLYKNQSSPQQEDKLPQNTVVAANEETSMSTEVAPTAVDEVEPMAETAQADRPSDSIEAAIAEFNATEPQVSDDDMAALKEALSGVGEAEVVCVVRSIKDPNAASRVVILNRASEQFVELLTDELDTDPWYHTTSLKTRDGRTAKNTQSATVRPAVKRTNPRQTTRSTSPKSGPRRYRRKRGMNAATKR